MRSCWSTDSVMFSGFVSRTSLRSLGSCTGIDVVTTGIVIRKMISSTSMTSTSGVVLIVETTSSSSPSAEPTFIAMIALLLHVRGLRRRQQARMQMGPEPSALLHRILVPADEPVVPEHGRDRHRQADSRHDQRFADRTCDLVDRCLSGDADRW